MLYRTPRNSPAFSLHKFVCVIVGISAILLPSSANARVSSFQANGELRLELPKNGNLRVENFRGAVIAEIWNQNYVSVSAVADTGEVKSLPAVVDRGEGLLSIRLARGPKGLARMNLELRIPSRAH